MATPVKVKKLGSGMAVLIPHQFARMRRIEVGSVVDLEGIKVVKRRRRYELADLMAKFKPEHRREEWDVGGAVGKEIW